MAALSPAERAAERVAALSTLSREELARLWEQRFGSAPPRGCGRRLLELAAAYGVQEQALGRSTMPRSLIASKLQDRDGHGSFPAKHRSRTACAPDHVAMKPGHGWCGNGTGAAIMSRLLRRAKTDNTDVRSD